MHPLPLQVVIAARNLPTPDRVDAESSAAHPSVVLRRSAPEQAGLQSTFSNPTRTEEEKGSDPSEPRREKREVELGEDEDS